MKKLLMILLALLLALPVCAEELTPEDAYRLGVSYEADWNWESAKKWYAIAAKAGHVPAMTALGDLYFNEFDEERDPDAGAVWLTKAAEAGAPVAMCWLGMYYVGEDSQLARFWLEKAASQGNTNAMMTLGRYWMVGLFGEENSYEQASCWFRQVLAAGDDTTVQNLSFLYTYFSTNAEDRAMLLELLLPLAEAGNVSAMERVAAVYAGDGSIGVIGSPPNTDFAAAAAWYHKAAEAGSAAAMRMLGVMYWQEEYGMVDREEALFWYRCAALFGNAYARQFLENHQ